MPAFWVDLVDETSKSLKARVLIHPRTGRDSMLMMSIRIRIDPFIKQYADTEGVWKYTEDFGYCVVQTDSNEGLPYSIPDYLHADGETLAQCFEEWLALPDKILQAWRQALSVDPPLNSPELLPEDKADTTTDVKKKDEAST